MSAERNAESRRGRHPRNPRISETVNPHEGVPAPDLNAGAEDDSIDIGADIDPENGNVFKRSFESSVRVMIILNLPINLVEAPICSLDSTNLKSWIVQRVKIQEIGRNLISAAA